MRLIICFIITYSSLFAEDFKRSVQISGTISTDSRSYSDVNLGFSALGLYKKDNTLYGINVCKSSPFELQWKTRKYPFEHINSYLLVLGKGISGKWYISNLFCGFGLQNTVERGILLREEIEQDCDDNCLHYYYYEKIEKWGYETKIGIQSCFKLYFVGVGVITSYSLGARESYFSFGFNFLIDIPFNNRKE